MLWLLYEFRCYASQEHEKFRLVRLLLSLGLDNIARNLCIQIVPKSSPKPPEEKPEKKMEPDLISHAQLECKRCFKQFPSQDLLKFFMHEKKCSSKNIDFGKRENYSVRRFWNIFWWVSSRNLLFFLLKDKTSRLMGSA